jgi:glutamine synthetase|tara:strand:+ start:3201 stop:4253 length:1053 start_codon:yes stop_codon:yes gene_type:complete
MEKNMKLKKIKYLWLDGYDTPNIRSKTKYVEIEGDVDIDAIPEWGFDGSSTMQAEGKNSDCILKPVKLYRNAMKIFDLYPNCCNHIVLCEVMNPDGTPHESNTRFRLRELSEKYEDSEMWFGIEQEYVIMDSKTERPCGWPEKGFPLPQGRYYCGVGGNVVQLRKLIEEHAGICIQTGIPISGTNAEVMLAQWEYQIGPSSPLSVCDDLWVARYLLESVAEYRGPYYITLDPKPIKGDWNGSGAHINFSTKHMREESDVDYINNVIKELEKTHKEHILEYGLGNEDRLTGNHETQHIDEFSSGNSDRGASIRIPMSTAKESKGYLEDRRPASNMDPYRAVAMIVETIGDV